MIFEISDTFKPTSITRIYNALYVLFAYELQTCFETLKRGLEPQTPYHHLNQYIPYYHFDTPKILSTVNLKTFFI